MQLCIPEPQDVILKVERCDAASRSDSLGGHWHVLEDPIANKLAKLGGQMSNSIP